MSQQPSHSTLTVSAVLDVSSILQTKKVGVYRTWFLMAVIWQLTKTFDLYCLGLTFQTFWLAQPKASRVCFTYIQLANTKSGHSQGEKTVFRFPLTYLFADALCISGTKFYVDVKLEHIADELCFKAFNSALKQ